MTLCRTWCRIREAPIPCPPRASRPTSAPGREPREVHRSHQNDPFTTDPIPRSARRRRISCTGPGRQARPVRLRHNHRNPRNRMPLVPKTCSEVQRDADSASGAGPDASPRPPRIAQLRSNLEPRREHGRKTDGIECTGGSKADLRILDPGIPPCSIRVSSEAKKRSGSAGAYPHNPHNRMSWVAKTCHEAQRGAISARGVGRDASPRRKRPFLVAV